MGAGLLRENNGVSGFVSTVDCSGPELGSVGRGSINVFNPDAGGSDATSSLFANGGIPVSDFQTVCG